MNTEFLSTLIIAIIGGLVGAWLTYFFSLRRDKEERRRERTVAHLIEAYRNLENTAHRVPLSNEQMDRLESSIAAIFLFGNNDTALAAKMFAENFASGNGDLTSLLSKLRRDLRNELGLDADKLDIPILRVSRAEK